MPVTIETPSEEVAAIYRDAELAVLQRVVKFLEQGIDAPDWAQQKLGRLQNVRDAVLAELGTVDAAAAEAIEKQISAAYARGGADAVRDLRSAVAGAPKLPAQQVNAVRLLADDIVSGVMSTRAPVLGFVEGVVRDVVGQAVAQSITTGAGRRAVAQPLLDSLLGQGLGGIQLPSGRSMNMVDYVSMATRTGIGNAQREGQSQTMLANDLNLITVEPGPRACDICDTYARAIMSLDGSEGTITTLDWATGGEIEVEIDYTLDEAIDDGFEHPNCRCSRRAYIPGITDPSRLERPEWDAEGYAAQQRQRELERQIRNWKTNEVISLTADREQYAGEKVDAWQQELRDHLELNPELKRQPQREQVGRVL